MMTILEVFRETILVILPLGWLSYQCVKRRREILQAPPIVRIAAVLVLASGATASILDLQAYLAGRRAGDLAIVGVVNALSPLVLSGFLAIGMLVADFFVWLMVLVAAPLLIFMGGLSILAGMEDLDAGRPGGLAAIFAAVLFLGGLVLMFFPSSRKHLWSPYMEAMAKRGKEPDGER